MSRKYGELALMLVLLGTGPGSGAGRPTGLTELSLEQLLDVRVIMVSRRPERLGDAPAAISVITRDDLRRTGVTTIADALRLVPGMQVGRIDANKWAITSRGFADVFSNKLLVMIDGRSVYTPLFSGVLWDAQHTLLEDVDRIEVIRGPGAALWGSNAVNGIVNVITRHARESQGGFLATGIGTEGRFGGVRYGGKLGHEAFYRGYAQYVGVASSVDPDGAPAYDSWGIRQGGFRIDWSQAEGNEFTVQGDAYDGTVRETYCLLTSIQDTIPRKLPEQTATAGQNIMVRWQHALSSESDVTLKLYVDRAVRSDTVFQTEVTTYDMDFQHRFPFGKRHEVMSGLNYRSVHDNTEGDFPAAFKPLSRTTHLLSAFVQDEVKLVEDRLLLTGGSKFEHNDFTGWEVQPNVRLVAVPYPRHTLWAAVSRAVRIPSRGEVSLRYVRVRVPAEDLEGFPPDAPPVFAGLVANPNFKAERIRAHEVGYRMRPHDDVSVDLAAFYNVYHDLRSVYPEEDRLVLEGGTAPYLVVPFVLMNQLDGKTYGIEAALRWQVTRWWRVFGAYSHLTMDLVPEPSSRDSDWQEGYSPRHQFQFRTAFDLPRDVQMDVWVRYVGKLPVAGVERYATMDLRLAWSPVKSIELSAVGQNLLHRHHLEFIPSQPEATLHTLVEREVYGTIAWRF